MSRFRARQDAAADAPIGDDSIVIVDQSIDPYLVVFHDPSSFRAEQFRALRNQLIAMGITAFLCVFVGTFPNAFLYQMLPNLDASYQPYTVGHVTDQYALLLFSALAFTLLMRAGLYPAEIRSTNLDADWIYRRGGGLVYRMFDKSLNGINTAAHGLFANRFTANLNRFFNAGPARLLVILMVPYWQIKGLPAEEIEDRKRDLYEQTRLGTFPVGVTAFVAVVLLGLLFFF